MKKMLSLVIIVGCSGLMFLGMINLVVVNTYRNKIYSLTEVNDKIGEADCVLVLGAGIWPGNRPSPMLKERLDRGLELIQSGVSDTLLMSGDHGRVDYDEVNVMKQYAIDKGELSERIFMDHAGFSTYESMVRAKKVFGVEKVIIVTQSYHMSRALFIANAIGLEAYGVASDKQVFSGQFYRDIREVAARGKDYFTVLLGIKPTYLGELIPISGSGDATNDY
jgi:SanA protein